MQKGYGRLCDRDKYEEAKKYILKNRTIRSLLRWYDSSKRKTLVPSSHPLRSLLKLAYFFGGQITHRVDSVVKRIYRPI